MMNYFQFPYNPSLSTVTNGETPELSLTSSHGQVPLLAVVDDRERQIFAPASTNWPFAVMSNPNDYHKREDIPITLIGPMGSIPSLYPRNLDEKMNIQCKTSQPINLSIPVQFSPYYTKDSSNIQPGHSFVAQSDKTGICYNGPVGRPAHGTNPLNWSGLIHSSMITVPPTVLLKRSADIGANIEHPYPKKCKLTNSTDPSPCLPPISQYCSETSDSDKLKPVSQTATSCSLKKDETGKNVDVKPLKGNHPHIMCPPNSDHIHFASPTAIIHYAPSCDKPEMKSDRQETDINFYLGSECQPPKTPATSHSTVLPNNVLGGYNKLFSGGHFTNNRGNGMCKNVISPIYNRQVRAKLKRRGIGERVRQKRQVLQDMARPLKKWLVRHRNHPYPTRAEKISLALGSQMSLVQVSNWFANARRRLKNAVNESCSWGHRVKLYNSRVTGNAELLSISSDDTVWDSVDEDDKRVYDEDATESTCPAATEDHSYSVPVSSQQCDLPTCDSSDPTDIPEERRTDEDVDSSVLYPLDQGDEYCPISSRHKYKSKILERYFLQDDPGSPQTFKDNVSTNSVISRDEKGEKQSVRVKIQVKVTPAENSHAKDCVTERKRKISDDNLTSSPIKRLKADVVDPAEITVPNFAKNIFVKTMGPVRELVVPISGTEPLEHKDKEYERYQKSVDPSRTEHATSAATVAQPGPLQTLTLIYSPTTKIDRRKLEKNYCPENIKTPDDGGRLKSSSGMSNGEFDAVLALTTLADSEREGE